MTVGPLLSLRARGPLAIYSRPELKTERMSYSTPTPSAMRGIFDAVLWKPAILWRIERIKVLRPIKFIAFRRNEVNRKAVAPTAAIISRGGEAPVLFADEDRAQRNTVALRDVDYVVEARFAITSRAGEGDTVRKFAEMFERRLEKGQHFHQPYFGCRECIAEVLPAEDAPQPISDSDDLGIMLWDIEFSPKGNVPVFFRAQMRQGVIEVPLDAEAARDTLLAIGRKGEG